MSFERRSCTVQPLTNACLQPTVPGRDRQTITAGCATKKRNPHCRFRKAERRGFEPLKPFWGLLAFQAGQFNHSCIFPDSRAKIDKLSRFCKCLLPFFGGAEPRRKESSASAAAASVRMQKKPARGGLAVRMRRRGQNLNPSVMATACCT